MRALAVLLLATALVAQVPDDRSRTLSTDGWTVDAGIYGTWHHFGNPLNMPPYYACGVAYELWYVGADALRDLDITARFPDGIRDVVVASDRDRASGWQKPLLAVGPGGLVEAAAYKHAGGAVGAACANGPTDLLALRGSLLRVGWGDPRGPHEVTFRIDDIRGEVTLCGGLFTRDGQIRPLWGGVRCTRR